MNALAKPTTPPASPAPASPEPTAQVLAAQVETDQAATPAGRITAKVIRVIDGDTIEIEGGQKIRYIGIDTPESKDPRKPVECLALAATKKNQELVAGRDIQMEKDVSETDRYGRLLRYVYVGDQFINEVLVKEGFAHASAYPPDIKYQDLFRQAEQTARDQKAGLWGDVCLVKPSPRPSLQPSPSPVQPSTVSQPVASPAPAAPTSGEFNCNCAKNCPEMSSCDEAYYQLNTCGCSKRDGDNDGVPCESICPGG
jgi:micrococcal nuclease